MFKWLLFIILAFLAIWFYDKSYIPQSFRNSDTGQIVKASLANLEYRASKQISKETPQIKNLVSIDSARLQSLFNSLDKVNKDAVVFLYDTNSFFGRYLIKDINELALKNQKDKKALFLVVAFEDDKDKLINSLKDLGPIYFTPIITNSSNVKIASVELSKKEVNFNLLPVVSFKDNSSRTYENLPVDFGTRKILEEKLE